ncbi:hypothetical protein Bbelb_229510, partial [Branchiostoma belcheri]
MSSIKHKIPTASVVMFSRGSMCAEKLDKRCIKGPRPHLLDVSSKVQVTQDALRSKMASSGNPNYPGGGGAPRPGFNMFPGQQMTQQGMMGPQGMMGVGPMPQGMMGVPQGMMGQPPPGQMGSPMQGMPQQGFRGSPMPGMAPQFSGMPQQYGVPVSGGYAYSPEMQKNYAEQQ